MTYASSMAGSKSPLAFPSLHKYTRKRQLYAKNGFYLAINSTGEITGTSDDSCLYAVLQFLSVGPDLIAIWGLEAKKYLAVDNKGKIFTTDAERKECVFREFFGKNFYNIFRTCHSDADGKGWYLSMDEEGKVSAVKVAYSDEPRLHFIVKTIKDSDCKDKDGGNMCSSITANNNSNTRHDKKTRKDFGLPSSEVVWIMYPYQLDEGMSDFTSSTPSPPSSSCVSGSSASTGEWTGSGDNNSTSV